LRDSNIADRLADVIMLKLPQSGKLVEIGPGLGALTAPLLKREVEVFGVEIDRGLAANLETWPETQSGRLKIFQKDILEVDVKRDFGEGPFVICGNIPYCISAPIVFWFIEQSSCAGIFTFQKEVAQKLCATPGQRDYGRLSIGVSLWYDVKILFDIQPCAFQPSPSVVSSVVLLTPKASVPKTSSEVIRRFTAAAFHARRKTLFNNLLPLYGAEKVTQALDQLGIDHKARAETLPPQAFPFLAFLLEEGGVAAEYQPF
jgi:16S rRNA (adenine1518-N6/adenine1519-N6)-dimethyltransferase